MTKIDTTKHDYCEETLAMEGSAQLLYLKMGERLHAIREKRLYEPFWSSWEEFTMEFRSLSPSSISKMISVYETFVLKHNIDPEKLRPIGWTKAYSLLPLIHSKEDAEKWIEQGAILTRHDLEATIREATKGIAKCDHTESYTVSICKKCGNRQREYGT